MSAQNLFKMGFLSMIAATGLFVASNGFVAEAHTTSNREGVKANTGVAAQAREATGDTLAVSNDLKIPGTPAPHGQIVLLNNVPGLDSLLRANITVLMKQSLADMAGKEATVLTVDYAPGAASDPHVHPGSVFVYVLEGTVVAQLEGEQPMTYTKGQSWYLSPKKPHVVSRNASVTEPAKLLVFLLSQEGEAIRVPVKSPDSGR